MKNSPCAAVKARRASSKKPALLEGQDGFRHLPARGIGFGDRLGLGRNCDALAPAVFRARPTAAAGLPRWRIAIAPQHCCARTAAIPRRRAGSTPGQQCLQIDQPGRRQRRQKLRLEERTHHVVARLALAEARDQQRPSAGVAQDASGVIRTEMRGDFRLAEHQIAGAKNEGAAIGQRPRETRQIGFAALGDDDAAISGGEGFGQRIGRAGGRDVPHDAIACCRRVRSSRTEMHRRADAPGDLAQQRRLAHPGRRLQNDDLLRAGEDATDQAIARQGGMMSVVHRPIIAASMRRAPDGSRCAMRPSCKSASVRLPRTESDGRRAGGVRRPRHRSPSRHRRLPAHREPRPSRVGWGRRR